MLWIGKGQLCQLTKQKSLFVATYIHLLAMASGMSVLI